MFTVSVASNGSVTLDQLRAIVHPDTSNPDDSKILTANNLVTLTATKTDGDRVLLRQSTRLDGESSTSTMPSTPSSMAWATGTVSYTP